VGSPLARRDRQDLSRHRKGGGCAGSSASTVSCCPRPPWSGENLGFYPAMWGKARPYLRPSTCVDRTLSNKTVEDALAEGPIEIARWPTCAGELSTTAYIVIDEAQMHLRTDQDAPDSTRLALHDVLTGIPTRRPCCPACRACATSVTDLNAMGGSRSFAPEADIVRHTTSREWLSVL